MQIVEGWQKHDPSTLKLERPDLRYTYDYTLSLHEAARIKRTGDHHIRDLETVSEANKAWETDVITSLALLRWIEDYQNNLDPITRALLEKAVVEAPEE